MTICAVVCAANGGTGETWHITIPKVEFALDEPIAIELTRHLSEPMPSNLEVPEAVMKLSRILRGRYRVQLRSMEGDTVFETMLLGIEFQPPKDNLKTLRAQGFAFFSLSFHDPKLPLQQMIPGQYQLVVTGYRSQRESNDVPIALREHCGGEAEAAKLFRESLPAGLLMILEQKDKTGAMNSFEELARDYPETIYGKYANVSLALLRFKETFSEHNNKGGAPVWAPVANDLAGVEKLFIGKHPLREMVLFKLASARTLSGDYAGARKNLAVLKSTFPHGKLGSKSEEFEKGITRIEKQKRSAESNEE